MENNKLNLVQKLNITNQSQVVNLPEVADRFKNLYVTFNGKDGAKFYEAEKFHLQKIVKDSEKLMQCTQLSIYGAFLDVAVNGLSFDPAMKHVYVTPRKFKVFKKDENGVSRELYEWRAVVVIAAQGELVMRMQQGQIKYADTPILVYEGDLFKHGSKNNMVYVEHEAAYPRKTDNIIACYLKITRPDNTVDYKVLSIEEVMKLKKFSDSPNSKAWTDGLPGMIQTKTVKHAFRSYPKIRILDKTKNSQLSTVLLEPEDKPAEIDIYGLDQNITPHEEVAPVTDPLGKALVEAAEEKENRFYRGKEHIPGSTQDDVIDEDFTAEDMEHGDGVQIEDESF